MLHITNRTLSHLLLCTALQGLAVSFPANAEFVDYRVNLETHVLKLYLNDANKQPFATFDRLNQSLAAQGKKLLFAMNAGIFMEDLRPLGLFIEDGQTRRKLVTRKQGHGNFYMQPNGVVVLDENGMAIVTTAHYPAHAKRRVPRYATQSGPMLVINGQINSQLPNSKSKLPRNAVCVIGDKTVVLSLAEHAVSFIDYAHHLKAIGCKDALYMDGAISDAYSPSQGRLGSGVMFGPMLGVTLKSDLSGTHQPSARKFPH
jgi:uncharacterized protein YigE (DUF2233 family)